MTQAAKHGETRNLAERPVLSGYQASFFDEAGQIIPGRIAARFGMTTQDLAETLGLGRDALARGERASARKSQKRLGELVEIIAFIRNWAGSDRAAMAWYRSEPIPAFGGRTPEAMVRSGKTGLMREFLDHMALGGYA
ncbi:MAG: antitoxin Xre/MbcA/ParS toxin-binding domain-containing protein [Devosia sp.]